MSRAIVGICSALRPDGGPRALHLFVSTMAQVMKAIRLKGTRSNEQGHCSYGCGTGCVCRRERWRGSSATRQVEESDVGQRGERRSSASAVVGCHRERGRSAPPTPIIMPAVSPRHTRQWRLQPSGRLSSPGGSSDFFRSSCCRCSRSGHSSRSPSLASLPARTVARAAGIVGAANELARGIQD
jgi:hypothetical protein